MATGDDIVASVRDATHQVYADGSGPVTNAGIFRMMNEEYPLVRRMLARLAPDWFTTVLSALVVASGAAEIDVSAVAGLDLIFEVRRLMGTRYRKVLPAGPDPESSAVLGWQRRGMSGTGTAVELYPASQAPGTYQLRYMATATPLVTGGGSTVLLPAGGERVLVESVAGRVKQEKLERDGSSHFRSRDLALKELAAQLGLTDFVAFPPRG